MKYWTYQVNTETQHRKNISGTFEQLKSQVLTNRLKGILPQKQLYHLGKPSFIWKKNNDKFSQGEGGSTRFHTSIFSPKLHILDSNGVWYSFFWSEGPKKHLNFGLKVCPQGPQGAAQCTAVGAAHGPRGAAQGFPGPIAPPLEVLGDKLWDNNFKF